MSTVTKDNEGAGGGPQRSANVKDVPAQREVREHVRAEAARVAARLSRRKPMGRATLDVLARQTLARTGLDTSCLGFAMVSLSNEFWRDQFAAVSPSRRLLLLPHCLRRADVCTGTYSPVGLECGECGACLLLDLKREAEALGYRVLIAEGTPAVVQIVLSGRADAILGVACLDSLDQAFDRIAQLGVPNIAVPLLVDGCEDTAAETDVVRGWLGLQSDAAGVRTRSYVPLLRAAQSLFDDGEIAALLGPEIGASGGSGEAADTPRDVQAIAMDWLRNGGKRFRPFITLASYAALAQGADALCPDADLSGGFPASVRRIALAIEALHKASLVHDDIEDDDLYRYGRETLHRRYGVGTATRVGDYLIGLGYRCVCSAGAELGADCAVDLVAALCRAHIKLCRGQGAELRCHGGGAGSVRPAQVQAIYALKTAPAFETAMCVGLRAAGTRGARTDMGLIRPFCRYLGVAYQVANDLKDWDRGAHDKLVAGQDLLLDRPTILRAFAMEAGGNDAHEDAADAPPEERIEALRRVYQHRGVFARARRLVELYKERARAEADKAEPSALADLMRFVVETVL